MSEPQGASPRYPIGPDDVKTLDICVACRTAQPLDLIEVADPLGTCFLTTAVCRRCGLVFRRRRPSADWFNRMWSVRELSQETLGGSPHNPEIERRRRQRYAATAAVLRRHQCGSRVIDVGCGPATGLQAFVEAGFRPTGLEPDRTRARFTDVAGVEMIEARIEDYAAGPHPLFDAVTCQHSLEHFHHPGDVLTAITSLVAEGGPGIHRSTGLSLCGMRLA